MNPLPVYLVMVRGAQEYTPISSSLPDGGRGLPPPAPIAKVHPAVTSRNRHANVAEEARSSWHRHRAHHFAGADGGESGEGGAGQPEYFTLSAGWYKSGIDSPQRHQRTKIQCSVDFVSLYVCGKLASSCSHTPRNTGRLFSMNARRPSTKSWLSKHAFTSRSLSARSPSAPFTNSPTVRFNALIVIGALSAIVAQ